MKKCNKCKRVKPERFFSVDRHAGDGLCRWCKKCQGEQHKEYYKNNPWAKTYIYIATRINDEYYRKQGVKNLLTTQRIKQLWIRDNAHLLKQPCLHRKDSLGHYSVENCVFMENDKHMRLHHYLNGRWALKQNSCVQCGTTERKHTAHGLCGYCYYKERELVRTT